MSSEIVGWSERYYPGLPQWKHDANNAWFESMRELIRPGGSIGVPNLRKVFNKDGEEIDIDNFDGTSGVPDHAE